MTEAENDIKGKVVLVNPPAVSHRTAEENLGLGYLAANLRKSCYSVDIIDGWLEDLTVEETAKKITAAKTPLFVGFSSYLTNLKQIEKISQILKSQGFKRPLVAGGMGPTFHPEDFLQAGIDVVIRGEAEQAALNLASFYLTQNPAITQISGATFIKDGEVIYAPLRAQATDINTIPFPARDTLPFVVTRRTPIQILTARGCNAHCLFCSVIAFHKMLGVPRWRERTISNIVSELELLQREGGQFVKVIDDSFIEPPRDDTWCKQFADEIQTRRLNLSLRGSIRADRVSDEVLYELKRAGFVAFSCGIENFSPAALKRMAKTATFEQNIAALELFKKHDIIMQQGMILFDPDTTMEDLEINYAHLRHYDFTVIKGVFTEMYAAGGTLLTKRLEKEHRLKGGQVEGNKSYEIEDPQVAKVYKAVKQWHKNHAAIYDMVIDPVSAPKALTRAEMDLFLPLIRQIRHRDLDFMRKVMDLVYSGVSEEYLAQYTKEEVSKSQSWYKSFKHHVEAAYRLTHLNYTAQGNVFL